MSLMECAREDDVVTAVQSARWPDRVDAELRAHVASCAICADVVAVALAFEMADAGVQGPLPVPSSAHMWWRLQMQARHDAARAAARPVAVAQTAATAGAVALGIAMIGIVWASEGAVLAEVLGRFRALDVSGIEAVLSTAASSQTLLALGAIAAGLVLMPVAVYFALSE